MRSLRQPGRATCCARHPSRCAALRELPLGTGGGGAFAQVSIAPVSPARQDETARRADARLQSRQRADRRPDAQTSVAARRRRGHRRGVSAAHCRARNRLSMSCQPGAAHSTCTATTTSWQALSEISWKRDSVGPRNGTIEWTSSQALRTLSENIQRASLWL